MKSTSTGILVSGEVPPVSDASVQTLTSLAKDFEELAHTCLLVLHLEVCVVATHMRPFFYSEIACIQIVNVNFRYNRKFKMFI